MQAYQGVNLIKFEARALSSPSRAGAGYVEFPSSSGTVKRIAILQRRSQPLSARAQVASNTTLLQPWVTSGRRLGTPAHCGVRASAADLKRDRLLRLRTVGTFPATGTLPGRPNDSERISSNADLIDRAPRSDVRDRPAGSHSPRCRLISVSRVSHVDMEARVGRRRRRSRSPSCISGAPHHSKLDSTWRWTRRRLMIG
jgi:hypothetical protein